MVDTQTSRDIYCRQCGYPCQDVHIETMTCYACRSSVRRQSPTLVRRILKFPGIGEFEIAHLPDLRELWTAYSFGIARAVLLVECALILLFNNRLTTARFFEGPGVAVTCFVFCVGSWQTIRHTMAFAVLKRAPGRCISCAYIRDGMSVHDRCPECGLVPPRLPSRPIPFFTEPQSLTRIIMWLAVAVMGTLMAMAIWRIL